MAELDTISVYNPLEETFTVNFNGEPYSIDGESEKSFPEFLAFHIAKHLSDKLLSVDVAKEKAKATDNPFNPKVGQLMVYDNPKRRIYLYDILRSKEKVEACVNAYPLQSFIGEMREYDEYVAAKKTPEPSSTEEDADSDGVETVTEASKKTTAKKSK